MALFTDGPPSTIEELAALDSQLLNVAHVEGIDVTQKLILAQTELSLELFSLLTDNSYYGQWLWVMTPRPKLDTVVVTPPLKLWHSYRTLEMVYSDAYNSQLNDRYAGKRDQFHEMAKRAHEKLREMGLGVALAPVPGAAPPTVVTVQPASGSNLPDGTYFVAISWTNAAGEDGAASEPSAVTTASSTFLVEGGSPPSPVTGYNVYAGTSPNSLNLQNAAPVPAGESWIQPGVLSTAGQPAGTGQKPNYFRPIPRVIQRG
jgi:hypothetical protein